MIRKAMDAVKSPERAKGGESEMPEDARVERREDVTDQSREDPTL